MNNTDSLQKSNIVSIKDSLTIIITASYIPSHPSTYCITNVIESLKFLNLEPGIKVILTHDFSDNDNYANYIENLYIYTQKNTDFVFEIVVLSKHGHLTGNIRNAFNHVHTQFVLVIQHDFPFIRNINIKQIIEDMLENPRLKHIRFNKRKTIKKGFDALNSLFGEQTKCKNFSYTRTPGWSDNNHICRTEYYQNIVLTECKDGKPMEQFLHGKVKNIKRHQKYGTYIFDVLNSEKYIDHLDGRKYQSI
tara:strand:+ start:586 stop:1332 length:747 start_codon:yes stop_codon:yes gene_type:complete